MFEKAKEQARKPCLKFNCFQIVSQCLRNVHFIAKEHVYQLLIHEIKEGKNKKRKADDEVGTETGGKTAAEKKKATPKGKAEPGPKKGAKKKKNE